MGDFSKVNPNIDWVLIVWILYRAQHQHHPLPFWLQGGSPGINKISQIPSKQDSRWEPAEEKGCVRYGRWRSREAACLLPRWRVCAQAVGRLEVCVGFWAFYLPWDTATRSVRWKCSCDAGFGVWVSLLIVHFQKPKIEIKPFSFLQWFISVPSYPYY